MKRGVVNTNEIKLSYVDYGGDGPYLILLHGVMSRATNWYDTAMQLKNKYHVIALDQRGHGLSDKPDTGYSRDDSVKDIIHFMDGLGIDRASFIGHSTGGLNAWLLAAHYPDRAKSIVIVDMWAQARPEQYIEEWKEWFRTWPRPVMCLKEIRLFFNQIRPSFADHFIELFEERETGFWPIFSYDHVIEILRYNNIKSWWEELKQVGCPALVVKGELSDFSRTEAEKMAQVLPSGSFIEIKAAYHVVYDDQPDLFNEAVEKFLDSI